MILKKKKSLNLRWSILKLFWIKLPFSKRKINSRIKSIFSKRWRAKVEGNLDSLPKTGKAIFWNTYFIRVLPFSRLLIVQEVRIMWNFMMQQVKVYINFIFYSISFITNDLEFKNCYSLNFNILELNIRSCEFFFQNMLGCGSESAYTN